MRANSTNDLKCPSSSKDFCAGWNTTAHSKSQSTIAGHNCWICVRNHVEYYPVHWICGKHLQVGHERTAFRPRVTSLLGLVSMYPEKGMIAIDMDPIMRPWSIRDRRIRIRNQKRRKPDQQPENNGADAGTTFVEQIG